MQQDPLIEKIRKLLEVSRDPQYTSEETPERLEQTRKEIGAGIAILDAYLIARGLIKAPAVPDRAFDMARKMLGEILDAPGIDIWRGRGDNGWTASITLEKGPKSQRIQMATVTDAEVAAELAKEGAGNGR